MSLLHENFSHAFTQLLEDGECVDATLRQLKDKRLVQISLDRAFEDGDFIEHIVKLLSFYNEKEILAPMMISISEESKDGRVSLLELFSADKPDGGGGSLLLRRSTEMDFTG